MQKTSIEENLTFTETMSLSKNEQYKAVYSQQHSDFPIHCKENCDALSGKAFLLQILV